MVQNMLDVCWIFESVKNGPKADAPKNTACAFIKYQSIR
ncbi:hypothetical protein Q427_22235 [Halomonas sp. BC04]|nr:hypothetical protein Q427_22235 [Halomonas sp. BC04]